MSVAGVQAFVHGHVPHEGAALYLAELFTTLAALTLVAGVALVTRSLKHLEPQWIIRVATGAAPIPVYVIMVLSPLDADLRLAVMHEQTVVALTGAIALYFTLRDFWKLCGEAITRRLAPQIRLP